MRKALGWALVVVVALCMLAYAVFNVIVDSTAAVRDAAIADVRARAEKMVKVPPAHHVAATTPSYAVAVEPLAVADCETRAARWAALDERISLATPARFDEEFSKVREFQDSGYDATALSEEEWARLADLAASRMEEIDAIKALTRDYDPACLFLQQLDRLDRYSGFEILLRIDLALAIHANDYDTAMEDLALLVPLGYRDRGLGFPNDVPPDLVKLVVTALRSKHVRPETWDFLSARLVEFRQRNFLVYHLLSYPKAQRGVAARKTSTVGRLTRELARRTSEPSRNFDVARWEPVMQELAELSIEPYYAARPALQDIIRTHELDKTDLASYFPDSPARSCISIAATSAFIEHASCQVRIDLLCIAIALARFHEDHETYPESIEATASYLGGMVPINSLNGQPYHYEAVGGAYRLGFGPEEAACYRGAMNAFGTYLGPDGCTMKTLPPPARRK